MKYVLISYVIGYIISYYLLRKIFRTNNTDYDWDDVKRIAGISIFSWIIVVVCIWMHYGDILESLIAKIPKFKVPKWL